MLAEKVEEVHDNDEAAAVGARRSNQSDVRKKHAPMPQEGAAVLEIAAAAGVGVEPGPGPVVAVAAGGCSQQGTPWELHLAMEGPNWTS